MDNNHIEKGTILRNITLNLGRVARLEVADGKGGVEGRLSNITVNTPPEGIEIIGNGTLQHPLEVKMSNLYKSAPRMLEMLVKIQSLLITAGVELKIMDELDEVIYETEGDKI